MSWGRKLGLIYGIAVRTTDLRGHEENISSQLDLMKEVKGQTNKRMKEERRNVSIRVVFAHFANTWGT